MTCHKGETPEKDVLKLKDEISPQAMRNLKKKDKSKTNSKVSSNAKSKYERSETFSMD